MNAFAHELDYAKEEGSRDFAQEAMEIALGKSKLLPMREHLVALAEMVRIQNQHEEAA